MSTFVLKYKMNKILNRFLLARDKFIPEMQLRQPVFLRIVILVHLVKSLKETWDSRYFHQKELHNACFKMTWIMEILDIFK